VKQEKVPSTTIEKEVAPCPTDSQQKPPATPSKSANPDEKTPPRRYSKKRMISPRQVSPRAQASQSEEKSAATNDADDEEM